MRVTQMFQTTAVSEDKSLSATLISIPARSVDQSLPRNAQETTAVLGGEYLQSLHPAHLQEALALALSSPAHAAAAALSRRDEAVDGLALELCVLESPTQFSQAILDEVLIPLAQSPIELKSLGAALSSQSG